MKVRIENILYEFWRQAYVGEEEDGFDCGQPGAGVVE